MKTNREEILQNCLSVFATMNYERASITELSRACGLSRMAIHHYFPNKQAVFTAVVDRYVFGVQDPANKFGASEGSLADFIDNYLDGIVRTMRQIVGLCAGKTEGGGAVAPNFHYFNLMLQTRRYYPGAERKFEQLYRKTRTYCAKPCSGPPRRAKCARHRRRAHRRHVPSDSLRAFVRAGHAARARHRHAGRAVPPAIRAYPGLISGKADRHGRREPEEARTDRTNQSTDIQ